MRRQRGVSLVIVLLTLSIMLLAVAAIFRANNGTLGIVGNLGFKQNATSVGDRGVEKARAWLMTLVDPASAATLQASMPINAYFAVWDNTFEPTTYDWTVVGNFVQATADDGTGNEIRYVVHRMCSLPGAIDVAGQQCVLAQPLNAGGSNQVSGLTAGVGVSKIPYYRITARVQGPRNTLSYVQVMVY